MYLINFGNHEIQFLTQDQKIIFKSIPFYVYNRACRFRIDYIVIIIVYFKGL